ncbi:MAG: hypothetical protein HY815_00790 [Candidatus Riflebacteria bacterium]|nr:hypothetical protein [Candidatus Riflebacteria bacterium]
MKMAMGLSLLSVLFNLAANGPRPPDSRSAVAGKIETEVAALVTDRSAAPPRRARPGTAITGVHVTGWITQSSSRMDHLIKSSAECELTAIVLEAKDEGGNLFFKMQSSSGRNAYREAIDRCHAAGLKVISRFVAFKDKVAEEANPAMRYGSSPGSKIRIAPWTDPTSEATIQYNLKLIKELKDMGVDEINLDYIRFPSGQERARVDLPLPVKCRKICDFVRRARAVTKGIRLSIDVFGYVAWDENSARVGQRFEDLTRLVDGIYPMLYPDHFTRGDLGFKEPSAQPYEVLRRGCAAALSKPGAEDIDVVPWIQCFTLSHDAISYGPTELLAQIQGTRDAGPRGFLAWNPRVNYEDLFKALRATHGMLDYTSLVKRYIPVRTAQQDKKAGRRSGPGGTTRGRPGSPADAASPGPRPSAEPTRTALAVDPEARSSTRPPAVAAGNAAPTAAAGPSPEPGAPPQAMASVAAVAPSGSASPEPAPTTRGSSTAAAEEALEVGTTGPRPASSRKPRTRTARTGSRSSPGQPAPPAAPGEALDARLYRY